MRLLGAVLAGGRSSRFGRDKAAALFEGKPLLDHVIAGLAAQTDAVVVCGREVADFTCLADRPAPDLGPLGGLSAALAYAEANGFDAVLTSACDTPFIPADLAERLSGPAPAIVEGQQLFGFWPAGLSAELDRFLARPENRAVGQWAAFAEARRIRYPAEIPNINTAADLEALHR